MGSLLDHLECGRCGLLHDHAVLQAACTACQGPLLARYRLERNSPSLETVLKRPAGQFRCFETCPSAAGRETPGLGEGATALLRGGRLGEALGLPRLLVKDESRNPTLSFKARGMAAAMARASELGVDTVCLPSAGNAAGAAAAYGALHGIRVVVALPASTPDPIEAECRALGAEVLRVAGTIADAARTLEERRRPDWFSLATLREPYRVEGKKVMGYELVYDLGHLPDVILYPTGGGTGLIGMWKAFDEMEALGWIGRDRPRMVAVQTAGCAPIVRAFEEDLETAPPWEVPEPTAAFGLRVPAALGDFLILRALRESDGRATAVTEDEVTAGTTLLATRLGLQGSPEGGACVAAALRLREEGWLSGDACTVIFNTGHGLQYLASRHHPFL